MPTSSTGHLTLKLSRLQPGEEWRPTKPFFSFLFASAGSGKCLSGAVPQAFLPGDVLVLNDLANARLVADSATGLVFWWFSLSLEHLFPLFAGHELCLLRQITETFEDAKLYTAATPPARECHRLLADVPSHFNLDHRSLLLRIASAVLSVELESARARQQAVSPNHNHHPVHQLLDKTSIEEIVELSVPQLAQRFNCSRRQLNRVFQNHFGTSVADLKMEMRLLKAVSLLRDPDTKVITVAEECGFNHLGLFNTCFKRRFGCTPGHFWSGAKADGLALEKSALEVADKCRMRSQGLCVWCQDKKHLPQPACGGSARR